MSHTDLLKKVGPALIQAKGVGMKGAQEFIVANVKGIDALVALSFVFGFEVDAETKMVTFPAA